MQAGVYIIQYFLSACLQLQLTSRLDEDAGIDGWAKCNRVSVLLAHAHHTAYNHLLQKSRK